MPWAGGYVALSSFGFGGANGHILIKSNPKKISHSPGKLPKLIIASGRTENAVNSLFDKVCANQKFKNKRQGTGK